VDLKKHLFVVVLAVIVLIGVGAYAVMVPPVIEEANARRKDCEDKAGSIATLASQVDKDDAIKTIRHVELADGYDKNVTTQTQALKTLLAAKFKLELRYDNMPLDNTFDIELGKLRQKLIGIATSAKVGLPDGIEKMMFNDPPTDAKSSDPSLTPQYRLRHMAIMEEIITILCQKPVQQDVAVWTPETDKPEAVKQVSIGALAIEKIGIAPKPKSSLDKNPGVVDALARGGRKDATGGKLFSEPELPYVITPVEIRFVASPSAVPPLLKALESSNRWLGVISRFDLQRATAPFDRAGLETAVADPRYNSHYQEGPVRVLVTLDLYEYSKEKDELLTKWLSSKPAAPAKK
jgi:hypothetical protein